MRGWDTGEVWEHDEGGSSGGTMVAGDWQGDGVGGYLS